MSLKEVINSEIEGVAEYMAMLYNFTGSPVAFQYMANGKRYALTLTEINEHDEVHEKETPSDDAIMESI